MNFDSTFLVIFDFHRLRIIFDNSVEERKYYALEYYENFETIKDKLLLLFPNKIIEISICAFLIKSNLSSKELQKQIIESFTDCFNKTIEKEVHQLYIFPINELEHYTHRNKLLELEVLSKN